MFSGEWSWVKLQKQTQPTKSWNAFINTVMSETTALQLMSVWSFWEEQKSQQLSLKQFLSHNNDRHGSNKTIVLETPLILANSMAQSSSMVQLRQTNCDEGTDLVRSLSLMNEMRPGNALTSQQSIKMLHSYKQRVMMWEFFTPHPA